MKNYLLLMVALFVASIGTAQCVPGTLTAPQKGYIIPDSATGFKHACKGNPYEQIIYIKVPKDTTITISGFPLSARIDSFIVNANITGLPGYLTATAVPAIKPAVASDPKRNFPHIRVKGDSLACVRIAGTIPATAAASTTPLTFNIRAYLYQAALGVSLDTAITMSYYKLIIDSYGTAGCAPLGINPSNSLAQIDMYPNPTREELTMALVSAKAQTATIDIIDMTGKTVASKDYRLIDGNNKLNITKPQSVAGFYLIRITTSDYNYSKSVYFYE